MNYSFFDGKQEFINNKPIRLITLFSGYDSQKLAFNYLGIPAEHWKTCEWAVKSIQALKDLHFENDNTDYSKDLNKEQLITYLTEKGISADYNNPLSEQQIKRLGETKLRIIYNNIKATRNLVNICNTKASDLEITNIEKFCYVMTYSFPCQDLSKAGKQKGMEKGTGTRSGMLWEVERLLDECKELPQVLLMENVPDVIGTKNCKYFADWIKKLETLGYKNYWKVLNATEFGVPQNRERCFMISLFGDYDYCFPTPIKLEKRLKDLLESEVDEKYYLSDKAISGIMNTSFECSKLENRKDPKLALIEITKNQSQGNRIYDSNGLSVTLSANGGGRGAKTGLYTIPNNYVSEPICLNSKVDGKQPSVQDRIYDANGVSTAITTSFMPNIATNIKNIKNENDIFSTLGTNCGSSTSAGGGVVIQNLKQQLCNSLIENNYRIRKLIPLECFRLMGVKDTDYYKIAKNQSNASLYHLAGDSIVVNVLMAILNKVFKLN